MTASIVQTSKNVTLVGAGEASKGILDKALAFAPYLIAADGGAELVLNCGRTPKKVIGDFDSINKASLAKIPVNRRLHIREQQSTDFEKCLRIIDSPLILGVGFLGRRLDHQLAALNALVRHNGSPCILIGEHDVIFHAGRSVKMLLATGSRVSLFPMRPLQGTSTGLEWPLSGIGFAPNAKIGTSNRVNAPDVTLEFSDNGMLVMLPPAALGAVVQALVAQ